MTGQSPVNNALSPSSGLESKIKDVFTSSSFELIPILLFILYAIGFLCLNTHLSRFAIVETNLLSFSYIKASAVFILFNVLLIFASRKFAHDIKLSNNWRNTIMLMGLVTFYCILYMIYNLLTLLNTNKLTQSDLNHFYAVLFLVYLSVLLGILLSGKLNNKNALFIIVLLGFAITLCCLYLNFCSTIIYYIGFSMIIYFVIFLQDYHGQILPVPTTSIITTSLIFLFIIIIGLFGAFIYNKIPQLLGGGKPYKATLYLTKTEVQTLRESCALENDNAIQQQVDVIYFSDKGFFIDSEGKIIIIPVESVKGIQVKRMLWLANDDF